MTTDPTPSPDGTDGTAVGAASLNGLARAPFVLLTTYRRTGEAVPTPVWAAPDATVAGRLWVTTPAGSGKVRRLAHTPEVTLTPCDRRGRTAQRAVGMPAVATVVDDDAGRERTHAALLAKHGAAVRVVEALSTLGRLRARVLGRTARRRVCLRLDPPT